MATVPQRQQTTSTTTATKSKVAVVYTTPETVKEDIAQAMHLAGYQDHISKVDPSLLKINISWQHYYPACSTSPWQLDGVIKTMKDDGYTDITPIHNGTVVVDAREGEVSNKHKVVEEKHGLVVLIAPLFSLANGYRDFVHRISLDVTNLPPNGCWVSPRYSP